MTNLSDYYLQKEAQEKEKSHKEDVQRNIIAEVVLTEVIAAIIVQIKIRPPIICDWISKDGEKYACWGLAVISQDYDSPYHCEKIFITPDGSIISATGYLNSSYSYKGPKKVSAVFLLQELLYRHQLFGLSQDMCSKWKQRVHPNW